jgi:hypothetical protein
MTLDVFDLTRTLPSFMMIAAADAYIRISWIEKLSLQQFLSAWFAWPAHRCV